MGAVRSLWLYPSRFPVLVNPKRWSGEWDRGPYDLTPFYEEMRDDWMYPKKVPQKFTVRWEPYKAWIRYLIDTGDEDELESVEAYIEDLARRMQDGEDLPPLVRQGRAVVDGRHRALAADRLGLKVAPVIDLSEHTR